MSRDRPPLPVGRIRLYAAPELPRWAAIRCRAGHRLDSTWVRRWTPLTGWSHNDVLYEWGAILGPLLLKQGLNYGIGGMYLEYQNLADPDDAAVPPTVTRDADQGVEYYNALADSPDRDYLRVPLIAGTLASSDEALFPLGNLLTFFAQTTGTTGVHGKPFSDAVNSKVFGAALVAFVDPTDVTRDRVLSRGYKSAGEQQLKRPGSQIGWSWEFEFQ